MFQPKVWSDHIHAFLDRKMGLGQLALISRKLQAEPGETENFPYWKEIGDVQEPAEDEGLEVDRLQDDSFSVTVKEVGKAVGWKDKKRRQAAAAKGEAEAEAQRQMAAKFAEHLDKELITVINNTSNHTAGTVATTAAETMTIQRLLLSKVTGFGDKQDQAIAVAMHSQDYANFMTVTPGGFLSADANDPLYGAPGFMGRVLGQALFVLDTMPEVAGGINGKKAWYHFMFKANPFGISIAEDFQPEKDRDILHRENIVAATMWYGTLGLHGKVSAQDKRVIRGAFPSTINS